MMDLEAVIAHYYVAVDAGDIDAVVALFAPTARYERAGDILEGKDAIAHFYRADRRVKLVHSELAFWQVGHEVFVEGRFDGTGADGSGRTGAFADHWSFDETGHVTLRRTSLFTGAGYVRQ